MQPPELSSMKMQLAGSLANRYGLVVRGSLLVQDEDDVPPMLDRSPALSLVLFGNAGSSLWEAFSSSTEYEDGCPDALDRWSWRIGHQIALQLEGRPLFPFGGPPHHPFLRWAKKAESLHNSRLGMLIHPRYGLWHAYRFAVALPRPVETDAADPADICAKCPDQPCVAACPADAFREEFEAKACYAHVAGDRSSSCRSACEARLACPYAGEFRYHPDQARFHMRAYLNAMSKRL